MEFISPKSTFKYILKCDRDKSEEQQTIWHFFYLTAEEEALISDKLGQVKEGGDFAINLGTQGMLALDLGLAEIENGFCDNKPVILERDETRKYIPNTKKRPWKRTILDMIPQKERQELANVAINSGELEEEDRKNS